jgi:acetoin utilization deacetylase AcuC-like enzyme
MSGLTSLNPLLSSAKLPLFYCDRHHFPLPEGHKFPLAKYRLLRETLESDAVFDLTDAPKAAVDDITPIHSEDYVRGFLAGTLDAKLMRRIGFPWSPELVTRTLASAGGTLEATRTALRTGFGGTLAGGTHHAFHNEGAGFCVFNDLAIAVGMARREYQVRRAAIIDLDVHQGDGTASLFNRNPEIFTLSLHGAHNFPFRKQQSSLDVELADQTGDAEYLTTLEVALERVWDSRPQLVLFQAGVDGLATDRLGRLSLTLEGLGRRDSLVIGQAYQRGIPLVITLGGGYSDPIALTVAAHAQTFRLAASIYRP